MRPSFCASTGHPAGCRCARVHRRPAGAGTTVDDHDCLFQSVAIHSSYGPILQRAYREPCGLQMGAAQPCGLPQRTRPLAALALAELPEGFGLKPFSDRTETRLCVYKSVCNAGVEPATYRLKSIALPTELKTQVPISTCVPQLLRHLLGREIQHAECRSPAGYLTAQLDAGCTPEPG